MRQGSNYYDEVEKRFVIYDFWKRKFISSSFEDEYRHLSSFKTWCRVWWGFEGWCVRISSQRYSLACSYGVWASQVENIAWLMFLISVKVTRVKHKHESPGLRAKHIVNIPFIVLAAFKCCRTYCHGNWLHPATFSRVSVMEMNTEAMRSLSSCPQLHPGLH